MASLCASFARMSVGASTSAMKGQTLAAPLVAPVAQRGSLVVMAATVPAKKPSVLKRQRVTETRRVYNKDRKSAVATRIKKVLAACAANESVETVEKLISEATSDLDKCVVKGILHKNTVARRKARLSRAKKALEATLN